MTRRSLASVAALTSVFVLGVAPTAAYAGKPTSPGSGSAAEKCEELKGKVSDEDCDYDD